VAQPASSPTTATAERIDFIESRIISLRIFLPIGRAEARPRGSPLERHSPRRRFGQNFLSDPHYVTRILDAVDPRPDDNIVEIGPGLAALTAGLIARAGHVSAIEIDRDLAARLRSTFSASQLTLYEADALAFDFAQLGARLRVVGNLPYNISSPLLFHLAASEAQLADIHVMLQREVVARMAAEPATPEYGRLSVMLQAKFRVTRLFVIPPGAFRPTPQVDSAFVRLVPLRDAKPALADEALFARIVTGAFGQRRKTLRNALLSVCDEAALRAADIDPQARGETLGVTDFVRLANMLAKT
jgi:16S rRNA (adenine1518-N6/adenine1519-N6)-dimethyltransferase